MYPSPQIVLHGGLKPNILKTQAFWAGNHALRSHNFCPEFPMKWTSKLKVLGIVFANDDKDVIKENFEEKLNKARGVMRSWRARYLTIAGKIVIIKTLLVPLFTHIFTALPNPPRILYKNFKKRIIQFSMEWQS